MKYNSKENPYTLLFGREPRQIISRLAQSSEILDQFTRNYSTQQIYMVTGVRGSGKTVFMTEISNRLKREDSWVSIELNPESDLLEGLSSKLASEASLTELFHSAKINLSLLGLGVEISGAAPIANTETAISRMLETMKKKGKRLLVTIDEVSNTPDMRVFAGAFQIFVRQELPIYLLMTGLYENINELQNEKSLTFLYRAPKIELQPLNLPAISDAYKKTLSVSRTDADKMAKLTLGYSFAFQVLGYFSWEVGGNYEAILDEYKQYLEDYVYLKIWSELSAVDRRVLYETAVSSSGKTAEILAALNMEKNYFSNYRSRLIKKGLLNGNIRGVLSFTLPMMKEFVIKAYEMDI